MKQVLQITISALCLSALVACNKSSDDGKSATTPVPTTVTPTPTAPVNQTGFFFYYFRDNTGCNTGSKSFTNLKEMCDTLLNDSANNNCARIYRQNDFNVRCQNVTGVTPLPNQPVIPASGPVINEMRSGWCSVIAVDQSGQILSGLRNRNNSVAVLWDSRRSQSFNLPFGAAGRYGSATLRLNPAQFGGEPEAMLTLKSADGAKTFTSKGAFQSSTRLLVDDSDNETTVVLDCLSTNTPTAAQQAPQAAIQSVECSARAVRNDRDHERGGDLADAADVKVIQWNGLGVKTETLNAGYRRNRVKFDLRLSQASTVERAIVEIEGTDFDGGKRVVGRGSLKTGFSLKHVDRTDHVAYEVSCKIK